MPRSLSSVAIALVALGHAAAAHAQAHPAAPLVARRAVPRYDGRAPAPPDAVDALAWIPRVVLSPLTLLVEGFRLPSSAVFHSHALYESFGNAAAGGEFDSSESGGRARTNVSVVPLVTLDWGRRPSVGAALELDPAGWYQRIALEAATGGERFYVGSAWDRFRVANSIEVGVRASWRERPDNVTYGAPGPDSLQANGRYFWMRRAGGELTALITFSRIATLFAASGLRWTEYNLADATWLAQGGPYAQRAGFGAWVNDAELRVDTRGPVAVRTGGLRLVARLHHGVQTAGPDVGGWVVGEVQGGAYLEVLRPGRVLGLEVLAADAEPVGGAAAVPFTELPTLGGDSLLRGFLDGRFRGPSVLGASLVYRWPVWIWLEAETRVGVGNAFGPHFDDFAPGKMFGSWSIALRTLPGGPAQLEVLFGLGTDRFDSGHFEIDSARIVAGVTRTF